jgi:ABC-type methionine transport system permease subunit
MAFTIFYSRDRAHPAVGVYLKAAKLGIGDIWLTVTNPRVLAAYKLSFGASAIAATINAVFGFVVAWTLVRYTFPGKRVIDAIVDLPFALPTAVSGIALTTLYAKNGWVGHWLDARLGIKAAFTPLGIVIALIFIGLPFVVRTLQPALEDLEAEAEEASASLGATRFQTLWRVIIPSVLPGAAHRVRHGLRARARRVRLGRVHLGQHADAHGNHSATHRREARAIRLRRRDRDRSGHAHRVVPDPPRNQSAAGGHRPPRGKGGVSHAWRGQKTSCS